MSDRIQVTINGRAIEVPKGTLVTDAARMAEVHVPIFCSHAKLPPLGACRICVVEIGTPKLGPDRKPVLSADGTPEIAWMPKVQTGCTTPVTDGMHVRSESDIAVKARKGVMEFLLVNHPLDCPVCDEGGECQLQDLAFAFGHDSSRMAEAKRVFDSEDLGPIVKKEANRCIVCMRCVRYCDEVMGDDALTAHQRGVHTEISSFNRQPLECEQCGNCIEVCPVGALTALPYRFKARPWDLRQHITVCPWCSNGCSVRLGVRGNEILRARGTEYRGVNQEYLCVRGRFGYEFVDSGDRLSSPLLRVGSQAGPVSWDEAITWVSARLREIAAIHGPDAIAFLGGERLNVEEQYLFQKLARAVLGSNHIDARTRYPARVPGDAILRATGGGRRSLTFAELYQSDVALTLGDDLQGEGPFAHSQMIRGQHQSGLHLMVAHPRRVKLAREKFKGTWLGYTPGSEVAFVNALTAAALELGDPANAPADVAQQLGALKGGLAAYAAEKVEAQVGVPAATLRAAAKRLRDAPRKSVLFGRAFTEHPEAVALLQAVENLSWAVGAITNERSFVMFIGPHSNSQGALDMGLTHDQLPGYVPVGDAAARAGYEKAWGATLNARPGRTAEGIIADAAAGKIKALWIASDELLASAPNRELVGKALEAVDLVIVNEMFLSETAKLANVVFPVASFAEKEGVMVNCERRLQKSVRALPPRKGSRPDWEIFQSVAQGLGANWTYRTSEDIFREIARLVPGYGGMMYAMMLPLGPTWSFEAASTHATRLAPVEDGKPANGEGLWLLSGGVLFLEGSMGNRTTLLPRLAKQPRAALHPDDAAQLGVKDGDALELTGPAGAITVPAKVDADVPKGSVFVPYAYRGVELNRLGVPSGAGLRVRVKRAVHSAVGA